MYGIIADLVLLLHALFVAFVVFGGLLALWKPRVGPWHLTALAWGAVVVGFGWICPLTPLENQLRNWAGQEGYQAGFIEHYLVQIIYPPGLTRALQALLASALIVGNALVYAWVLGRWRKTQRLKNDRLPDSDRMGGGPCAAGRPATLAATTTIPGENIMNEIPALAEWIIDQASDALIYADREGRIARWNQAAHRLFGYSPVEALGSSLDLIIPEHLRAAHWKGFDAALSSGKMRLQGRPTLTRALGKGGRKIYVEMTFALVKDSAGTTVGSVAMARDATERVEKERMARKADSQA